MKKWLLTLGSISSVIAPVSAVIACGTEDPTPQLVEDHQLLKSNRAMSLIEKNWQEQTIKQLIPTFDKKDTLSTTQVKNALVHILHKKLVGNKNFLRTIANKILIDENFEPTSTTSQKLSKLRDWGLLQYINNGDITIGTSNGNIKIEALKFMMENMDDIRKEVYKKVISVQYMLNVTTADYQDRILEKGRKLNDTESLIESSDFMLIKKMIELHLFVKWDVTLDPKTSVVNKWINPAGTTVNVANVGAAVQALKDNPTGNFAHDAGFKIKQMHATDLDILHTDKHKDMIGYQGAVAVAPGKGKLKFDKDGLVKATTATYWNGGLKDGELINSFHETKLLNVNYVEGILPIFASNKLTLTGTSFENNKERLALELTDHSNVYENAVKFLVNDIDENTHRDDFLFEIKSKQLRDAAIEYWTSKTTNGEYCFIKED